MVGKSFSMWMTHLIFIIERVDLQNSKLTEGLTTLDEKEGGCKDSRRHRDRAEAARIITTSLLQLKGPGIVKTLLDYAYKSLKWELLQRVVPGRILWKDMTVMSGLCSVKLVAEAEGSWKTSALSSRSSQDSLFEGQYERIPVRGALYKEYVHSASLFLPFFSFTHSHYHYTPSSAGASVYRTLLIRILLLLNAKHVNASPSTSSVLYSKAEEVYWEFWCVSLPWPSSTSMIDVSHFLSRSEWTYRSRLFWWSPNILRCPVRRFLAYNADNYEMHLQSHRDDRLEGLVTKPEQPVRALPQRVLQDRHQNRDQASSGTLVSVSKGSCFAYLHVVWCLNIRIRWW